MIGLTYKSQSDGEPALELRAMPDPEPADGEILIDVRATALNRADLLQVRGLYPPPPGESEVPGLECAGTVLAVGPGVSRFVEGDRVMALLAGGGHATHVVVPEAQAMAVPEGMSWVQAAALPEAALTSWTNLAIEGQLQSGQTCLISGAASGIGTFAVQLARELGATVFVAGRDMERLESLRNLGADRCFVLGSELAGEVREASGGGVDLVMDLVGGEHFESLLKSLVLRGRLVLVGLMAGPTAELNLGLLMRQRLQIVGSVLRSRTRSEKAGLVAGFAEFAASRWQSGALEAVVSEVRPFESLPQAYEEMARGGLLGKLVIEVPAGGG